MFPTTSLLLGSSMLWSVAPMADLPVAVRREITTAAVAKALVQENKGRAAIRPNMIRETAGELFSLVEKQRKLNTADRVARACRVFYGLHRMFEDGDRRVLPIPEFFDAGLVSGDELLDESRVLWLADYHAALEDDALSAYYKHPAVSRLEATISEEYEADEAPQAA